MTLGEEKLKFFAGLIEKEIGIVYAPANFYQLEHRLSEIKDRLRLADLDELYAKAKDGFDRETKELLLDLATNNETSFFRDANVFSGIEKFVVPELLKRGPMSKIAIWSAACSTGQEPYALAIQLENAMKAQPTLPDYSIFCSDFSERVLKKSQQGEYSKLEVQRGLSEKVLTEYFMVAGENVWKVRDELKRKMRFSRVNLLDLSSVRDTFDLIMCRNVLIYQTVENKKTVLEGLRKRLSPGGFLILGGAESLVGLTNAFEMIQFEGATFYRKVEN